MNKTLTAPESDRPSVFLAGGISGCPDWQADMVKLLDTVDVTIFNPRRPDFPMGDKQAGRRQVKWEFCHLRRADFILFWFAEETLQPIALFELGAWSMAPNSKLFVGTHPNYGRRFDVITQLKLVRPDVEPIAQTLEDLASVLRAAIRDWQPGIS